MERLFKTYGIPLGLLTVKLLITVRTGIDTYNVSHDILDVFVIDGVYLTMWLVAAYGGKSQSAMGLRPFAAAGAWILYAFMFYIAWQAGNLQGTGSGIAVSIISRVAGVILLAFDTWDYIHALLQERKRTSDRDWKDSLRSSIDAVTYIIGAVLATPVILIRNVIVAGQDYWKDTEQAELSTPKIVVGKATPVMLPRPESDDIDNTLLAIYKENPSVSLREAAKQIGISHTAVGNRLSRLEAAGKITRNENGISVTE